MTPEDTAIDRAIEAAPAPVREYIMDGSLSETVVEIGDARQLHVDTIGILAELSRNMLVGLASPSEVLQSLISAGVSVETGNLILGDLNEKVFFPLHTEMKMGMKGSETPVPSPAAAPSTAPADAPRETVPQPSARLAPAPAMPSSPSIMPAAPAVPLPAAPVPLNPYPADLHPAPAMRTMASDMQALKEHREPEPLARPAAALIQPPPPPIAPAAPVPPPIPVRAAAPPPDLPGAPRVEKYGVDPYREPVE